MGEQLTANDMSLCARRKKRERKKLTVLLNEQKDLEMDVRRKNFRYFSQVTYQLINKRYIGQKQNKHTKTKTQVFAQGWS